MGSIGAAKPLDRLVSAPPWLKQEVNAALLILHVVARMIAAPGSASVGKDENMLFARHKALGFNEVGALRTGFEALLAVLISQQPPRASSDFGDFVCPKARDDRVERTCNRWHRAKHFEHSIAHLHGRLRNDWIAVFVKHWPRIFKALFVIKALHLPRWKGIRQIISDIFTR